MGYAIRPREVNAIWRITDGNVLSPAELQELLSLGEWTGLGECIRLLWHAPMQQRFLVADGQRR